ncbi:DNA-binding protein [Opitutaceae bacterium TAV4]|nr:DNA-binding protein [Opitutaceae bacterium TAV4]RRK01630.1 DNA-binding protein [Opitutaceae bacterium TAV3]
MPMNTPLCTMAAAPAASCITHYHTPTPAAVSTLTDIHGLRTCGIFPAGREPSIRTLREWTKLRRIPCHKVGHFVYYDPHEVMTHIRTKLKIPARA